MPRDRRVKKTERQATSIPVIKIINLGDFGCYIVQPETETKNTLTRIGCMYIETCFQDVVIDIGGYSLHISRFFQVSNSFYLLGGFQSMGVPLNYPF